MNRLLATITGTALVVFLSACTKENPPTVEDPITSPGAVNVPDASSSSSAAKSSTRSIQATSTPPTAVSSAQSSKKTNAGKVSLAVPFAPQAPFAVWDPLHEEACEEMSLLMVKHFYEKTSLPLQTAENEVQELIAWETDQGYGYDVTVAQLGAVAEKHFGLNAEVISDVTEESLIKLLDQGLPIIVPAAGRTLGNPYFSGEGPWYHMLVVVGYRTDSFGTTFITNDPGTKRGEGYPYRSSVLLNAIHDWTGVKEDIESGPRKVLIVRP